MYMYICKWSESIDIKLIWILQSTSNSDFFIHEHGIFCLVMPISYLKTTVNKACIIIEEHVIKCTSDHKIFCMLGILLNIRRISNTINEIMNDIYSISAN